jgi:hypothetical protein
MTFSDLADALKDQIARCGTERDLRRLERHLATVRVGDDGLALLRFLSPAIADRRHQFARSLAAVARHGATAIAADCREA